LWGSLYDRFGARMVVLFGGLSQGAAGGSGAGRRQKTPAKVALVF